MDEHITTIERILRDVEEAFAHRDLEALVASFTDDATIESYLVARVFDRKDGVCRGRAEIEMLVRALWKRGVPWGKHAAPIVRGNVAAIEYGSASSEAETFSVDIIEVSDGKIRSLRAYAGWRAVMALTDEHEGAW